MLRKIAIVGSTVALALVTFGTGTAHAAAKVNASGTLHCSITGKVKLSSTLTFGGPPVVSNMVAKVAGTGCTGTSGVQSVKGQFVAPLPSSDCTALAALAFPQSTFSNKVKYKGAAKYNPSATTFSTGAFGVVDPVTLNVPGAGTATTTGSFAGEDMVINFVFNESTTVFAGACGPKTKGVKPSGGLKKMSFGPASTLDVS
jgi:hypothetical protein